MTLRDVPALSVLLLLSAISRTLAESQYFEVLQYQAPSQCTRSQCLNLNAEICREFRKGFFLREKGCLNGKICTNCVYGNGTAATRCKCENPPYSVPALYNEACTMGKECAEGQGICYRPCNTFWHISSCPEDYCFWDTSTLMCADRSTALPTILWTGTTIGVPVYEKGVEILASNQPESAYFPMTFSQMRIAAEGFRVQGVLIENITTPEALFLQLDTDINGEISAAEFTKLPEVLRELDRAVIRTRELDAMRIRRDAEDAALKAEIGGRRLQTSSVAIQGITPEVCSAQNPKKYFCSFDVSCKTHCRECGWKSATDRAFSICVPPSPDVCYADGHKVFCESDQSCHPAGDCSNCVDRTVVDHSQHTCLALWWNPKPLAQWTNWVCRHRNKVGMPCNNDQDCIFGMRRCLAGACAPFQPYNANQTCVNDFDCPHNGFYCPSDPTGGQNSYWVQYCRKQRTVGMTCAQDRECAPGMRCNTGEPQPRCRKLFSLETGSPAAEDVFCMFGWRDRDGKCAPPAKSKEAGRSCDTDLDCPTNDETGRTGKCTCKAWWDKDDSKYCLPVAGDYARHQEALRNYLWFRAQNCGSFWTEKECLRVFGDEAMKLKLKVECETQELSGSSSGGPYLPPESCGIVDNVRFGNKCAMLEALR